jgi:hypothetical protein
MEALAIYPSFIPPDPVMCLTAPFHRQRSLGSASGNTGYRIRDLVALLLAYHKLKPMRERHEHIIRKSGGFVKDAG